MRFLNSILGTFVLACLLIPKLAFAELKLVATLPTLGAIAKAVAGDKIDVITLASPREDPHFVDPSPDFVLKLNRADILLYNGMEYEIGWLPTLQKNARNPKIDSSSKTAIDASQFIEALGVPKQKIERSAGDIHPQGNPHYLYSLDNVILIAKGLAKELAQIDPENAEYYQKTSANFLQKAQTLNDKWKEKFNLLPETQKRIVAYHDSLIYLRAWLGLDQGATLEPKPGIAPNPAHIAKLVALMKDKQIKIILQESYQPSATSERVAKLTEAKLIIFSPGPKKGEDLLTYFDLFIEQIFKALS